MIYVLPAHYNNKTGIIIKQLLYRDLAYLSCFWEQISWYKISLQHNFIFGFEPSICSRSVSKCTASCSYKVAHTRSITLHNIACCATWLIVYGADWLDRECANLCCAKQFCATWLIVYGPLNSVVVLHSMRSENCPYSVLKRCSRSCWNVRQSNN
jgi:hypothetical protein